MRQTFLFLAAILCIGCFSSDPASEVWPAKGRWGVSKSGSNRATIDEWAGNLQWRTVFDKNGNQYRIATLVNVSGPNPRDQVSRFGTILKRRPMPPVVYLTERNSGPLITQVPEPEGRWKWMWEHYGSQLRVYGTMYSSQSGGYVIAPDGKPEPVCAENPTTIPAGAGEGRWDPAYKLTRLHGEIRPLIFVERMAPILPND